MMDGSLSATPRAPMFNQIREQSRLRLHDCWVSYLTAVANPESGQLGKAFAGGSMLAQP
jgi:hypothetical protein